MFVRIYTRTNDQFRTTYDRANRGLNVTSVTRLKVRRWKIFVQASDADPAAKSKPSPRGQVEVQPGPDVDRGAHRESLADC
jgi:hypothetical protein